jgi:hypothetical protein
VSSNLNFICGNSFDYKNKYAIIEYLKEIAGVDGFYLIILTHNFDFHRSVCGRLDMKGKETRKNVLNVVKTNAEIKLVEEIYQNNPLKYWRNNLDKPNMLLASIPMVRNLFEYSGKDTEFQRMTSFLHIQNDSFPFISNLPHTDLWKSKLCVKIIK